jgi:hypothetical protein
MEDVDLDLRTGESSFHPEHPSKLMDQEDRVMKRNTSRVMKHNPIL